MNTEVTVIKVTITVGIRIQLLSFYLSTKENITILLFKLFNLPLAFVLSRI